MLPQPVFSYATGDYLNKGFSSIISVAWKISDTWSFHAAYLNYQSNQRVAEHGFDSYIDFDSVNLFSEMGIQHKYYQPDKLF
jgi:hypothetical protein